VFHGMDLLKFTSCQAANADATCRAIVNYLAARLPAAAVFVDELPWQERKRLLDEGDIHAGWICGLPYVQWADRPNPRIELLAAPVMAGERYEDRPIYFSDVVVHRDSPFQTFADLRGASWAYNEPGSQSGYHITQYHLATLGETWAYFGRLVSSGAHQRSLQMILNREIDASAIDSTVLETELARSPELGEQIRLIATLGPSPIPPWIVGTHLPLALRQQVRDLFLQMHEDAEGAAVLAAGGMTRFTAVTDHDYDPIRYMARVAARAS
jgi:phosphonate transport system substrate-binding protein